MTDANWRVQVRERISGLNWQNIQADVSPFVEPGVDLSVLNLENLVRVLGK